MNKKHLILIYLCAAICAVSLTACSGNYQEKADKAFSESSKTSETSITTTSKIADTTNSNSKKSRKEEALDITKDFFNGDGFSSKSDYVNYMKDKGYTSDEIKYCLKKYKVDWNKQAVGQARAYLLATYGDLTSEELKDMLKNVGYTDSQIEYALKTVSDTGELNDTEDTTINNVSLGESNALGKALEYIEYQHFSPSGLKEQLKYEGFTDSEAQYGVDNCGADWNEQAAGKAQEYLNSLSLSREGLKEQLEYEGFNESQITYALSAVGY